MKGTTTFNNDFLFAQYHKKTVVDAHKLGHYNYSKNATIECVDDYRVVIQN